MQWQTQCNNKVIYPGNYGSSLPHKSHKLEQMQYKCTTKSPYPHTLGSIVHMLALGKLLFKPSLGNSDRISFWDDHKIGSAPLKDLSPCLFNISRSNDCPVSALHSSVDNWNFQFRRNLREEEICEISSLLSIVGRVSLESSSDHQRS